MPLPGPESGSKKGETPGRHERRHHLADRDRRPVSMIDQLAAIPEEEIWLSKQKSARTRRACRLDVQHFMRTLSIGTPEELRQADHKAVIAWENATCARSSAPCR
jgi:hypothetical protein